MLSTTQRFPKAVSMTASFCAESETVERIERKKKMMGQNRMAVLRAEWRDFDRK
jgi:hypothetical protein